MEEDLRKGLRSPDRIKIWTLEGSRIEQPIVLREDERIGMHAFVPSRHFRPSQEKDGEVE